MKKTIKLVILMASIFILSYVNISIIFDNPTDKAIIIKSEFPEAKAQVVRDQVPYGCNNPMNPLDEIRCENYGPGCIPFDCPPKRT